MHGTIPLPTIDHVCNTVVTARAFADLEDAHEAERLVRAVTANVRAKRDAHDAGLALTRLVRIGQRATVMADPEGRRRATSPMIVAVRWHDDGKGSQSLGFHASMDELRDQNPSLILFRTATGWRADIG